MSEYIVKIYWNVICDIFFGRYDVHIHFIITFFKRYVSWLNNSKLAVVQLLICFQDRVLKYAAI